VSPHGRAPQPFVLTEPIDYEDGRMALKTINERRTVAREDLENATGKLIDAERDYRKERARLIGEASGTALEKKEWLDGKTADKRHERDGCEWAVKIIQERLEELDAQRASLHRLIEWSIQLDPTVAEARAHRRAA
jgi:septal ring factor EnvC (AmiA/AmiB activator)